MEARVREILSEFEIPAGETEAGPFGGGHINSTYRVSIRTAEGEKLYILQRINSYVFKNPQLVVDNIEKVTDYLREAIRREGGDPARETLRLIPSRNGGYMVRDAEGGCWRMYDFITHTVSKDLPDTPALFRLCGEAFGHFQKLLGGFPADTLSESIPNFHNTPDRLRQLREAVERNASGRRDDVLPEIAFCEARAAECSGLVDALARGEIPLRVTHNDTKLNNVLLDEKTGRGVCVIDLDTVMPGLAAYDFGDSIRTGASTAAEDERDLSLVNFSLPMYRAFAQGFLSEVGSTLTRREIELLPLGAKLMTLENGIRFLTDHLNGDLYFHIHREGQNLDRARTQFRLVQCMEENWEAMKLT